MIWLKQCSIEGCDSKVHAKGLCSKHYNRIIRNGDLILRKRKLKPTRYCEIEGCNNKHYTNGYCQMHYRRLKRHGDPNMVSKRGAKRPVSIEGCCVKDCLGKYFAKGFCKNHYQQYVANTRKRGGF